MTYWGEFQRERQRTVGSTQAVLSAVSYDPASQFPVWSPVLKVMQFQYYLCDFWTLLLRVPSELTLQYLLSSTDLAGSPASLILPIHSSNRHWQTIFQWLCIIPAEVHKNRSSQGRSQTSRRMCWCCSVTQSFSPLCDSMRCSMPGFLDLPYLLEFVPTPVCDATQPSHPLSPPSPPALTLSQHQGLFQ